MPPIRGGFGVQFGAVLELETDTNSVPEFASFRDPDRVNNDLNSRPFWYREKCIYTI